MFVLKEVGMAKNRMTAIALSSFILAASNGIASAQYFYLGPTGPYGPDGLYENRSVGVGPAPSRVDHWRFDRSGTRGRLGLGADPLHPEGPGNPSNGAQ